MNTEAAQWGYVALLTIGGTYYAIHRIRHLITKSREEVNNAKAE